ncbi:hypothetical protein GQ44DRAFT_737189 [Phaeosphaeriaceae sp. PMI808]|nr:hypothetical protein GQ44DRAFT_737189 [Phaeosphaeriaceae sp. PMI808]
MVESRQEEVLAIIGIFTVFSFIFVVGRIYSRFLGRNFAWDDHLIVVSMVLLLAQTIAIWKFILRSGTGFHIWDLPKRTVPEQLITNRWNFAVQMIYHPLMFSIRASIIMFLFRMKDNRRRIRYSLHVVFWLNVIYAVGTSMGNILQCSPVRYAWMKPAMDRVDANGTLIKGGTCIDSRTFVLTSCALSIFMDLIIIPIPSIMVWNLQMEVKTKFLVVLVMSLGWVATGVSVGRFIVYYYRFAPTNTDRTWNIGLAISIAEPAVHIMTACAPATKSLFRYLFPYFARSRSTTYYEDRTHASTQNATHTKLSEGGTKRGFGSFNFGLQSQQKDDGIEEISMAEPSKGTNKDGSVYDLKGISTVGSQDTIKGINEDKTSIMEERQPQHCLAQTK